VEVVSVTSSTEHASEPTRPGRISLDDLARQRGVRPVDCVEDMAEEGVFSSDEELEAFLSHVQASRRADLG
jgi:hypothetical protein